MPRVEEINIPQAYFFTENVVNNHGFFVQWATSVSDDTSLMLTMLERLVVDTQEKNSSYYALEQNEKEKDAIRVAHMMAQINRLADHEYNIFESAFLEEFQSMQTGKSTRRGIFALVQACLVVATQIFFTVVIATEVVEAFTPLQPGTRFYTLIVPIAILSAVAFFFAVMTHGFKSSNFNTIMGELACFDKRSKLRKAIERDQDQESQPTQRTGTQQQQNTNRSTFSIMPRSVSNLRIVRYIDFSFTNIAQKLCLVLNSISNVWLGIILVILNVPFVMTAQNPTEAILNALATGFIIEIDDLVRRVLLIHGDQDMFGAIIDWNNDRVNDLLLGLATRYVSNPEYIYDFQEIFVTKKTSSMERRGVNPYHEDEECHIFVVQEAVQEKYRDARTISVLIRKRCTSNDTFNSSNTSLTYDHVKYIVSGPGMQSFIDDLTEFNCYRPWKLRRQFLETFGDAFHLPQIPSSAPSADAETDEDEDGQETQQQQQGQQQRQVQFHAREEGQLEQHRPVIVSGIPLRHETSGPPRQPSNGLHSSNNTRITLQE